MKRSRVIRLLLTVVLILSLAASITSVWAEDAEVTVEVASVKGTVTVKRAASEKTFSAFAGLKLKQGDVVTTGSGGEVVINIGQDKTVKALADSSFKISSLSGTDADSQAGFTLIKGTVFNEVRSQQSSDEGMTVRTGNTVVGVRGTTYTVSLRGRGGLTVHTLEGSVFLDSVIKRLTEEQNAALVHQQTVVEAGQGMGQSGAYTLSIEVLIAEELQFIVDNPQSFAAALVAEAGAVLESLPAPGETPPDETPKIVYQPEPAPSTDSGGGGGSGSGGTAAKTYTVTFSDDSASGYVDYFSMPSVTATVTEGQTIPASVFNSTRAAKVGHTLDGWYNHPTSLTATRYIPGVTPVTGNLTLYPRWTQDLSQDGSPAKPYLINADNFAHFRYFVHDLFIYNALGASYELTEDIDFSNYVWSSPSGAYWAWEPIGGQIPFEGTFDGGGFTISNFSQSLDSGLYAGFFGFIYNGSVTNLHISGTISINSASPVSAGGIAGSIRDTEISRCTANVTITAEGVGNSFLSSQFDAAVGGIAGQTFGSSVISDCAVSGTLAASGGSGSYPVYAGGVAGAIKSGAGISHCYFRGELEAASTAGIAYAGGIAGENENIITDCMVYSGGVISSTPASAGRIWGATSLIFAGSNNYASDFAVSGGPIAPIHNGKDGGDVAIVAVGTEAWWTGSSWSAPWDFTSTWEWSAAENRPVLR